MSAEPAPAAPAAASATEVESPWVPTRCWAICLAAAPLHLALALLTDLSPDEAYYLAAARAPGVVPPIHDHPPLLVWLLRAADLAGPVELRVRVLAILLSLATSLACVALARARGADARGAEVTAWITSWALLPTAGGFVATPDGPFLLAFVGALFFAARGRPVALAACVAAAALAKVTALPLALVLAASEPRLRRPVLAGCFVVLPFVVASLRFQLAHAFVPHGWSALGVPGALVAALAAQAALWSPPTLTRGLPVLRTGPRVDLWLVAALTALLVASALARSVPPEPNWWAPAGLVAAVGAARADWTRGKRTLLLALLGPTAIAAAHTVHPFLPIPRLADPTARLHGWRDAATEPLDAPGLGSYGHAAERCIYRSSCDEITNYFERLRP